VLDTCFVSELGQRRVRKLLLAQTILRSSSYTVQVFLAQALTLAFKAVFVHMHSVVRLVAHVDFGIPCVKHANYMQVLEPWAII